MNNRHTTAAALLDGFAEDTGLTASGAPRRYLWTDAFAVCTWLGLHQASGEQRFLELALRLVDAVHSVLGRHREDEARAGWISGLEEDEGKLHPTAGGLRIGKPLPERAADQPYDPQLEWDRDGQYYHYLTKWIHALDRTAGVTGERSYQRWAVELARAAHRGFVHSRGGRRILYWKMSIDLSRPLVPSMGQHDPLDGLVVMASLDAPELANEVTELEPMCAGRSWATDDALGIGGLLADALRLAQLVAAGREQRRPLLEQVAADSAESLKAFARHSGVHGSASRRLAFRELGLALGLHAVQRLAEFIDVRELSAFEPLAGELEDFWLEPRNQAVPTWIGHRDINTVTLAASLAPEGFLGVPYTPKG